MPKILDRLTREARRLAGPLAAGAGILSACLAVAACAMSASAATDRAGAIQAILEEDRELGTVRNHAPESGPLAEAVRAYVRGLDAIDFSGCPADFTDAFKRHRDAWHASIPFFEEHAKLRGELHDLFAEIRESNTDARERLASVEKAILDTWAEVEAAVERNQSDTPAWSPESADLLFVSNREGNSEIYLLPAGSAEWINLTRHPAGDNWPEWSPDGSRIAFQSRRGGNLDIWVMNADGSDPVQLTDDPEHDYLPAWSADGEKITFTSWRSEPSDAERANHVYIMNADGSGQRRLFAESPGTSAGVAPSADGSFFVATRKIGEQGSDIFLVGPDGEVQARLTDDESANGAPALSPDGSRIAYYAQTETGSELVVVNLDGSARRSLHGGTWSWYPRWSPDGRWLVYTATKPDGDEDDLDVLAIPVEGGDPLLLAGGPDRESEGRWRPRR